MYMCVASLSMIVQCFIVCTMYCTLYCVLQLEEERKRFEKQKAKAAIMMEKLKEGVSTCNVMSLASTHSLVSAHLYLFLKFVVGTHSYKHKKTLSHYPHTILGSTASVRHGILVVTTVSKSHARTACSTSVDCDLEPVHARDFKIIAQAYGLYQHINFTHARITGQVILDWPSCLAPWILNSLFYIAFPNVAF